jgi:hypothetical protein
MGDQEQCGGRVGLFDVEETKIVFGLTHCEVAETFRTDCKQSDVSLCLDQETSVVDDSESEKFAVFESPVLDGLTGNWAAATEPVPAVIDDNDDDDFETTDFHCAPEGCVGLVEGEVSITCTS